MDPLEISIDKTHLESTGEFVIFTHSVKTRYWVLTSFCIYLLVFFLFMDHLKEFVEKLDEVPAMLKALEDNYSVIFTYAVMGLGILVAIVIFFYLLWAVADVWGIQVHLSSKMVQVRNTVTGNRFRRLMGVGEVPLDELEEVVGGFFSTRLVGVKGHVQFSPVDRIEVLISQIMENAPKANYNVR